jgi:YVTN family beta-propeller protein
MVKLRPDARWAYVSHSNSKNVAAVELATGRVELIETGARPEGSALSPDGKLLYVVNREAAQISVIDTETQSLAATIRTGSGPVRVKTAPDGTVVYALMHDKAVGFAHPVTRAELAVVPLEGSPVSLDLSPDGRYAFASAQDLDTVYVVSVPDRKLVRAIRTPDKMFPDPVIALP